MDSPLMEDEVYLCKGCSEPLEEGKAFELAGQRWHLPCFRCSTCGNVLDADANLLLLGDGNLICHSCTYSCSACNQKIEDLAILTGDQAFCSGCFRCRNCKKKIENLRYARTSQGIFCMSCHETLMARRRKKTRAAQPKSGSAKEKALPSLPPGAAPPSAFSPDLSELETPPSTSQVTTPPATSPPQPQDSRRDITGGSASRGASPYADELSRDGPTLPASTYGEPRPSNVSHESEDSNDHGFLPMAFDPTPPVVRKQVPTPQSTSPPAPSDARSRDYFGSLASGQGFRDLLRDDTQAGSSRSGSSDRDTERAGSRSRASPSPHIMYQDKSRYNKSSESEAPAAAPAAAVPTPPQESAVESKEILQPVALETRNINQNEGFKLQEAPKSKKGSLRSSKNAPSIAAETSPKNEQLETLASETPSSTSSPNSSINPFDDPKRMESGWTSIASRPTRSDSLARGTRKMKSPTPDLITPTASSAQAQGLVERNISVSSVPSSFADARESLSRDNSVSKTVESPVVQGSPEAPPPRASARLNKTVANDEFTAPRLPPAPPLASAPIERHKKNESSSTTSITDSKSGEPLHSAHIPMQSMDAPFSMEEEMARIMRGDKQKQSQGSESSVLRKMSNAVKHGRSFSDRAVSSTGKSPANGGLDATTPITISSPLLASPTGRDTNEQLAAQLKRAQQRVAELESEVYRFEEKVNNSTEIKAANNELREKRSTIVVLDTQRELVVRELEAMTDHLTKAKDSSQPLDIDSLRSDILKDFADSVQRLKDSLSSQIEDLMHKRNVLQEEISNLIRMKDKGFQEYEALSNKNAQLQEMNNQILHNIQDMYKSNRGANGAGAANGLGIYHPGAKLDTPGASEVRNLNLVSTDSSMPNLLQEQEGDQATLLTAPKVVNIRKDAAAKKFNWRKGGEKVAKNVTKGIKGAFGERGGTPMKDSVDPYGIGMPYGQMQAQAAPTSDLSSVGSKGGPDPSRSGSSFGFFVNQKPGGGLKPGGLGSMKDSSSTNLASDGSVLFGSELTDRCEFEKRVIPSIVSCCVEEVESRGLDAEGIYRKSGGSGQVKVIQQGFEKDPTYDITDSDLDIHAVTSTLKQYFRKLPTPLITYDVYDSLLDAGRVQDKEKQAVSLRMIVGELPEHHRDCLEYLIQHLARVMAQESENLMTPLNLAVVFAPTIMRPLSIEREMSDMQAQRIALQALLEHHAAVFPDE